MSNSPQKPTIFFIPGAWHRPTCYDLVIGPLKDLSYPIETVNNPSTSATLPPKGLTEDIENVRAKLEKLIDTEGKDVVIVMHSYGGCVGTASIEGLDKKTRQHEGKHGGVAALFFITAYALPKGAKVMSVLGVRGDYTPRIVEDVCTVVSSFLPYNLLGRADLTSYARNSQGLLLHVEDAAEFFYHDIPVSMSQPYVNQLLPQSRLALRAEMPSDCFNGLVPCTYLICTNDRTLPLYAQEKMANSLGEHCKVIRCNASHSPFLSQPGLVVQLVRELAGENM